MNDLCKQKRLRCTKGRSSSTRLVAHQERRVHQRGKTQATERIHRTEGQDSRRENRTEEFKNPEV